MPCRVIRLPDGTTVFVKMAAPRPRKCSACGRPSKNVRLCDGATGRGKTCDAVLCTACTVRGPNDTDYCPLHVRQADGMPSVAKVREFPRQPVGPASIEPARTLPAWPGNFECPVCGQSDRTLTDSARPTILKAFGKSAAVKCSICGKQFLVKES